MTNSAAPDPGGTTRGPRRFQDFLTVYKRQGCRILVTGDVDSRVMALQNRLLLGPEAAGRDRTLALVDVGGDRLDAYVPDAAATEGGTRLVRYQSVRDTATDTSPSSPPVTEASQEVPTDLVYERERSPLVDLRAALVDVAAVYREQTDTTRPAELRVGVATLRPLLDEYPHATVRQFVRIVGNEVSTSRGYAHFLLPIPSSDPLVDDLLSCVDVHIRLRDRRGTDPEQSWHLVGHGETSGWITLEP